MWQQRWTGAGWPLAAPLPPTPRARALQVAQPRLLPLPLLQGLPCGM